MLNGLDIFSGIGGGADALAPWVRPRAYCECDESAQSILLERQRRGEIPVAPIWDDIRTLTAEHLPFSVDIVYGGFPCQDISVAGTGKGLEGERSGLFFEIIRLCGELRPRFVFLENVPAITTRGGVRVLKELTRLRYDCRWTHVSAAEIGAPHLRKRWFLLAYPDNGRKGCEIQTGGNEFTRGYSDASDAHGSWKSQSKGRPRRIDPKKAWEKISLSSSSRAWPSGVPEPTVRGSVDGFPSRSDRISGLGNAWVPLQARTAFERLIGVKP